MRISRRAHTRHLAREFDAPRPDGGRGWKGLRLRKDVAGTQDGLAKAAYIRESRRIQAEFTILEKHVGAQMRGSAEAATFDDSVGVGCYRIDLHPTAGGANYIDISSLPFQIPLGALIPKRVENVLAACKNIGTTHITNGCYRLPGRMEHRRSGGSSGGSGDPDTAITPRHPCE